MEMKDKDLEVEITIQSINETYAVAGLSAEADKDSTAVKVDGKVSRRGEKLYIRYEDAIIIADSENFSYKKGKGEKPEVMLKVALPLTAEKIKRIETQEYIYRGKNYNNDKAGGCIINTSGATIAFDVVLEKFEIYESFEKMSLNFVYTLWSDESKVMRNQILINTAKKQKS